MQELFFVKPAFMSSLMEIADELYKVQQEPICIMPQQFQKNDLEQFKIDQKSSHKKAESQYKKIVENIIRKINHVSHNVVSRCDLKDEDDLDGGFGGQPIKNISMVQAKIEQKLKRKQMALAKNDNAKLKYFIRLMDYMAIETL